MAITIQRLVPGDEPILHQLAIDSAHFEQPGHGAPLQPLEPDAAQRYLANPAVLHWVAMDDITVVGSLYCTVIPCNAEEEYEVLLYEIGVHHQWRRHGVGRMLLVAMEEWMQQHAVSTVWVLADNPAAAEFYRACGFVVEAEQPVYMTRTLNGEAT
ncbi:MAG: GNAT family N-acetyltransferase [Chloroflexaceae bacterium]|nr:GNAT family N-acetyltransferase [Chloroflexaceae bacterium]